MSDLESTNISATLATSQTSSTSISTIVTALHPKVVDGVTSLLAEAKARGISCGVQCGLRTADEQARLWNLGRTTQNPDGITKSNPLGNIVTKAKPFESFHNYGLAVDIVFKNDHGNWTWDKTYPQWELIGVVGEMFGFKWGGRWKFQDEPHFEMIGKLGNVAHAREVLLTEGIEGVWKLV